jgi:hypothetical protein
MSDRLSDYAGYVDLDDLQHDPKLAEALGHMVVVWARAETSLLNIFAHIMNIHFNRATLSYYRIPTYEARTKVLLSALDAWGTEQYDCKAIAKCIIVFNRLSKARNNWVHGVWCTDRSKNTVIFDFRAPEDSGRRLVPVKATDVENHVQAVRRQIVALEELLPSPFYSAPESSPGKSL